MNSLQVKLNMEALQFQQVDQPQQVILKEINIMNMMVLKFDVNDNTYKKIGHGT